jgi:acetylornithine/N-succinyldiaminopimelate aminotransferase
VLGVMIGFDLPFDASNLVGECLKRKLLINATHGHVVRLLPALTITDEQIDEGCAILADVLRSSEKS